MNIVHVYPLGHQWVLGLLLIFGLLWLMLLEMGVWTPGVPTFPSGIPRSGLVGPRGGSVISRGCTNSHSHHQSTVCSRSQSTCFLLFDRSLPGEWGGFSLHLPCGSWCWVYSQVPLGHLGVFLVEMSIQVLCAFEKSDHLTFCYWVVWVIYVFCISVLYGIIICKYFLPWVVFHSVDCAIWCSKVLRFDEVEFIFSLVACDFRATCMKSSPNHWIIVSL